MFTENLLFYKEESLIMAFIDTIYARAKADKKTIVLPESMDKRTYEAAEKILKEGIANLVIIGTPEEIEKYGKGYDISGATIVDPFNDPNKQKYIDKFVELRSKKGVTPEMAKEQMEKDYMYYACLMCKCGDADGAVSGACHSTGNTIRPALQLLKTKPGISSVSGFFLMEVPNCELGENGLFVFADCAVNPDLDSEKLAEVAALSADSFKSFVGAEPKVAMLSFSSYGSAKHDRVTMVADAVKIAKEKYPDITVDGELQLDAALVPEVAALKAPNSKVAGKANTLVFPSLEAGNIGYKLVQRLAKAGAYGPVLQGLSMPVNDLSRGCFAEDIVGVVAMTAVQAQDAAATEQAAPAADKPVADAVAEAAEASAPLAGAEEGGIHKELKTKFIEGTASFMSLVAIALVIGLAFCIERIIYLSLAEINTKKFLAAIEAALEKGDVEAAKDIARNTRGPIASIYYQGLMRIDQGIDVVEKSVVSYGGVQAGYLEKGCSWITLFIAMAPSLGFLGTVIGMVQAFDKIQQVGDISPTVVAGGMKVALITTIFGLIVALILQVFYNYILSKIEALTSEMEDSSISLLDMVIKYDLKYKK